MRKLRTIDLVRISLRLSLLQVTWSEGGMQAVGLSYCLVPGLKRMGLPKDEIKARLARHREPFSTHPFLASVIAGAILKMNEEERDDREVMSFLRDTMGPLAAVGDPFFLTALPALASAASGLAAILLGPLVGILMMFVLFNSFHLLVRLGGIALGYREGHSVLPRVGGWIGPARTDWLKTMAALLFGVLIIAATAVFAPHGGSRPVFLGVVAASVAASLAFKRFFWLQPCAMPIALALATAVEVIV